MQSSSHEPAQRQGEDATDTGKRNQRRSAPEGGPCSVRSRWRCPRPQLSTRLHRDTHCPARASHRETCALGCFFQHPSHSLGALTEDIGGALRRWVASAAVGPPAQCPRRRLIRPLVDAFCSINTQRNLSNIVAKQNKKESMLHLHLLIRYIRLTQLLLSVCVEPAQMRPVAWAGCTFTGTDLPTCVRSGGQSHTCWLCGGGQRSRSTSSRRHRFQPC